MCLRVLGGIGCLQRLVLGCFAAMPRELTGIRGCVVAEGEQPRARIAGDFPLSQLSVNGKEHLLTHVFNVRWADTEVAKRVPHVAKLRVEEGTERERREI